MKIFGILNITPDSFSDGGEFFDPQKAFVRAEQMFAEGADFVDVGGESTRPGAEEVSSKQEWDRVGTVLKILLEKFPGKISLDTRHPETAKRFLQLGDTILNDVSGFRDSQMIELAVRFSSVVIVNHFPGDTPGEVHKKLIDSAEQVRDELLQKKKELLVAGVLPENIILDPGIGFGKTRDLNWKLLEFATLVPDEKVMIGHSRKRFLGENRFKIERNLEAAKIAVDRGAAFLRVHDVATHIHCFCNFSHPSTKND